MCARVDRYTLYIIQLILKEGLSRRGRGKPLTKERRNNVDGNSYIRGEPEKLVIEVWNGRRR